MYKNKYHCVCYPNIDRSFYSCPLYFYCIFAAYLDVSDCTKEIGAEKYPDLICIEGEISLLSRNFC